MVEQITMRIVIQRVSSARLEVGNKIISKIGKGILILLGISDSDNGSEIEWLSKKAIKLRIFPDENGKMNLSVKDIEGEILLVSQFTLYANCKRGNRPDFIKAAKPEKALELYNEFANKIEKQYQKPQMGIFGAYMKISLTNDGPVTIILDNNNN